MQTRGVIVQLNEADAISRSNKAILYPAFLLANLQSLDEMRPEGIGLSG